jgi:hypothetical protein
MKRIYVYIYMPSMMKYTYIYIYIYLFADIYTLTFGIPPFCQLVPGRAQYMLVSHNVIIVRALIEGPQLPIQILDSGANRRSHRITSHIYTHTHVYLDTHIASTFIHVRVDITDTHMYVHMYTHPHIKDMYQHLIRLDEVCPVQSEQLQTLHLCN